MDNIKSGIAEVVDLAKEVVQINEQLQKRTVPGSTEWQQHEAMDEKLHEFLILLGD